MNMKKFSVLEIIRGRERFFKKLHASSTLVQIIHHFTQTTYINCLELLLWCLVKYYTVFTNECIHHDLKD